MNQNPLSIDEVIEYLSAPLETQTVNKSLYYKPYHSKIDDLIDEILERKSTPDGSRVLSPITLLDNTVITPPIIGKQKEAYYAKAIQYGDYIELYISDLPTIKNKVKRSNSLHVPANIKTTNYTAYGIEMSSPELIEPLTSVS